MALGPPHSQMEIVLLQNIFTTLQQTQKAVQSLESTLGSINATLKEILTALQPPKPSGLTSIDFVFNPISTGENKMPLTLPDNQSDTYSIIGKDAQGLLGVTLAPGQTVTVVSSDPATVVLTPDATPLPVPAGETAPAGTPTIASGVVASATPPAQPNVTISVTATVLNADGSTAATATDTVTIVPGALASIGELFGVAVPLASIKK